MHAKSDLDVIFETMSTAVLVVDAELKFNYANHSAETMLQVSNNQLHGLSLSEWFVKDCLDFMRLRTAIQDGESFSVSELQLLFADGRFALADMSATSIERYDTPMMLLEFKLLDQQKRISQETMQWSQQQAARELIRGLAHEIKNPLGGIRGAAQLLEKNVDADDVSEYTGMIIEQSDRLRNLVDRLLGPNSPPDFAYHNIHRILEKIRTLATFEESYSINIVRDYDPSIPDLWLDDGMIQQALLNIVRNSMQALNEQNGGTISLRTRIERQMTIHGQRFPLVAEIKIIDDGPGIPEHLKDTLFYPMVTGKQDGTGLGLSIAQTLIDHHRGKIEVDSWPGHTEFTLYLPIDKKEPG